MFERKGRKHTTTPTTPHPHGPTHSTFPPQTHYTTRTHPTHPPTTHAHTPHTHPPTHTTTPPPPSPYHTQQTTRTNTPNPTPTHHTHTVTPTPGLAVYPGSLAQQSCPAVLPGSSVAWILKMDHCVLEKREKHFSRLIFWGVVSNSDFAILLPKGGYTFWPQILPLVCKIEII
jgi:hypothetical protein